MERFLHWSTGIYKKPLPILLITAIITVIMAMGIPLVKADNDVKAMLPPNSRERLISDLYDKEDNFGSSNAVFVGIQTDDIYSNQTLQYIKSVKDKIENLNKSLPEHAYAKLLGLTAEESVKVLDALRSVGINDLNYQESLVKLLRSSDELQKRFAWEKAFADKVAAAAAKAPDKKLFTLYDAPLGKIQSLVNADYIAFQDDALVSKKMIDNEELTAENIKGLKERVHSWDTYNKMLYSQDEKLTSIIIILKSDDKDVKSAFNADLHQIMNTPPAGYKIFIAGEPVIVEQLGLTISQDMPMLIPFVFIIILLMLFFCFRTIQGVVYPLLITIISIIWTIGMMGYLNIPLTSVGSSIPVLLMAIVSAYGIHQMNHYYEDPVKNKLEVLIHNSKSVGLAIFLSGITVMIGFGSLATQSFVPIRDFGIFTAWGDLVGVLGALFILPALLLLGKTEKKVKNFKAESEKNDLIAKILHGFVHINRKASKPILISSLVVALVLLFGSFYVKSELDVAKFFKENDPVHIADTIMNEKMAGTKSLTVVLDSDLRDPVTRTGNAESITELTTPEVLSKIDQFAVDLKKKFPNVQKVNSFSDVLKKMNQEMNGGDTSAYKIPADPALISQYLMIFAGDTKTFLTTNHDKLRINLTMNQGSLEDIHQISLYSQAYFDQNFQKKNHLQVQITGDQQIAYTANQELTQGTVNSIFLCVIIVFIVLLIILRSFIMSFIAVIPIAFCLLVDFGFLGFTGTSLNTATAMVSSIGIGIGVDFSIHFITWYRRELRVDLDIEAAIERSIINKGRAILYNLFVIVGGFLVLLGSSMVPMNQFGFLTALCMSVTALGALLVVPALLKILAKKKFKFLYLGVKEISRRPGVE